MRAWLGILIVLASCGCAQIHSECYECRHQTLREDYDGSPIATGPTLAKALLQLGIDAHTLVQLRLVGDEASYTSGLSKNIGDQETLSWFFDHVSRAEPYTFWYPSGYRKIELFTSKSDVPVATLLFNESGSCQISGVAGRYMCFDLGNWVQQELREVASKKGITKRGNTGEPAK